MEIPVVHIELIEGKPYILGGKVKVRMIAEMYLEGGASVEDLMERYALTAAEVHTALAYYYDHQEAFDEERRQIQLLIDQAKTESEARLEQMREKVRQMRDPS